MQNLSPLRITIDMEEEMILQILLDKNCRAILEATREKSKTVAEISGECNVPRSTIYRKLRLLKKLKFLHVLFKIGSNGKKLSSYKNKISGMNVLLRNSQLQIQMIF